MSIWRNKANVILHDQTTQPLDFYFTKQTGTPSTLDGAVAIDDTTITLVDATDFAVDEFILILSAQGRFYAGQITAKVINLLTLDTPFDFAFADGDEVLPISPEMNVNGSITPQIFKIRGDIGETNIPIKIDVTRIIFKLITTDPPEFSDFGDIANGLTNGIVLRRNNGLISNIVNVKTNGDLANLTYDLTFYEQTGPQGINGIVGRLTFAGQEKHGVAIRLGIDESLDLIIQDDLSSLISFRIIAQGHIVED